MFQKFDTYALVALSGAVIWLALFGPLTAHANDFTGAVDNNWFEDGNWSDGHIPQMSEPVYIQGFDVHALKTAGDTLKSSHLYLAGQRGPGSASLYSELPLKVDGIDLGYAYTTPGTYSATLTVDSTDVIMDSHLDIATARGGAGYTAEGSMTITNGSLYLPGSIQIGQADNNGTSTGRLTVINGNIIGTSNDGLYCGEVSSDHSVTSNSSVRLENGRLEAITEGYFGYASGGGTSVHCDVTLIHAECLFEGDVYVAYGSSATAEISIDNSYFSCDYLEVDDGGTLQLHIDGTERVTGGNVSTPGKYAAIDVPGSYGADIRDGARLELHFGYTPAPGDSFDVIVLAVGEEFGYNGLFTEFATIDLDPAYIAQREIIPGDTTNGEILRVTVVSITSTPSQDVVLGDLPGTRILSILSVSPSPFNPATEIAIDMSGTDRVEMDVYDVAGRLVRTNALGMLSSGVHRTRWDGRDGRGQQVSSGIYFVRLRGNETISPPVKAILVR